MLQHIFFVIKTIIDISKMDDYHLNGNVFPLSDV